MKLKVVDVLRGLVPEAALRAVPPSLEAGGLAHDSRRVAPGDLYVALVGARFDGRDFAPDAAARGAVAVVGPARRDGDPAEPPWIEVDDPRSLLAPLAARVYGAPHEALTMLGVTGTNGKSSVVALVSAVLGAAGRPTASFGTLGYRLGGADLDPDLAATADLARTTPEAPDLFRLLAAARARGAEGAAMEVSSHALAIGRVDGLRFDVGVFTNLSRDHLDFHRDENAYFAAKRRLFDLLREGDSGAAGVAVVHAAAAEPRGRSLAAELSAAGRRVVRYGLSTAGLGSHEALDVHPLETPDEPVLDLDGLRARFATPRGPLEVETRLVGRYNLENVAAVVAVGEALELPHEAVREGLATARPLPGRLEPVDAGQDFPAFVDFAHTPAALEATLRSLGELSDRRIVCVFGCGGDRDAGKRPEMGEIAGRLADLPVATSDNPRAEDPLSILHDVEHGLRASGNRIYRILPDRRQAIRRAVHAALRGEERERHDDEDSAIDALPLAARGTGWLVLVAGKGHETTQDLGDRVVPFDDRDELRDAIRSLRPAGASHGR